ncbi:hypothetical protein MHYP_G00177040 [Metynnis hypsauchen]
MLIGSGRSASVVQWQKVKQGQWTVKEACLVLCVEKLSAELKTKDWQLNQTRKRAVRLNDREAAEALEKQHLEAQMKQCIQKLLEVNKQLQGELLMKEERGEKVVGSRKEVGGEDLGNIG